MCAKLKDDPPCHHQLAVRARSPGIKFYAGARYRIVDKVLEAAALCRPGGGVVSKVLANRTWTL